MVVQHFFPYIFLKQVRFDTFSFIHIHSSHIYLFCVIKVLIDVDSYIFLFASNTLTYRHLCLHPQHGHSDSAEQCYTDTERGGEVDNVPPLEHDAEEGLLQVVSVLYLPR